MAYEFFYSGPFSNFFPSNFVVDGIMFNCNEQYFQYKKARMFNDTETAKKILKAISPFIHKRLGRNIKGYDDIVWKRECEEVMIEGLRAKFSQNESLRETLLDTYGKFLVEASPFDIRWGIGLKITDPKIKDRKNWRGENLLGKLLTKVREELSDKCPECYFPEKFCKCKNFQCF
jgi:conserved hypothetical protein, ribA/ribD-fused